MSLWERIKSIFKKKENLLEEGNIEEITTENDNKKAEFLKGLDAREEQKEAEKMQRQFSIARDVIEAKRTTWKNDNITAEEGLKVLLNNRGYAGEEVSLGKLDLDILNQMAIQASNISQETMEYFQREDMQRLVGKIKNMAVEEAKKFGYAEGAAKQFIPYIPDAMNVIKDEEIAEREAELEETK